VQRCPKTPQEKRAQAQAKKLKPQIKKRNKGLNENGHEELNQLNRRKVPWDCFKGTQML